LICIWKFKFIFASAFPLICMIVTLSQWRILRKKLIFITFSFLIAAGVKGNGIFLGFGFSVTLNISSHSVKEFTCENLKDKRLYYEENIWNTHFGSGFLLLFWKFLQHTVVIAVHLDVFCEYEHYWLQYFA
jgi:hypothetical protein